MKKYAIERVNIHTAIDAYMRHDSRYFDSKNKKTSITLDTIPVRELAKKTFRTVSDINPDHSAISIDFLQRRTRNPTMHMTNPYTMGFVRVDMTRYPRLCTSVQIPVLPLKISVIIS